jgi:tRNA threonylcarbamoyl adenosine modification protein (Sua5/YciO/YrdC/YwlC family)
MLRLCVHPINPSVRDIRRAAQALRGGGLVVFPTDTTYALGCDLFAKRAIAQIYQLKGLPEAHPLGILCPNLAEVARYAVVENPAYRILRQHLPGRYTFILPATQVVPKLLTAKKRTLGVRIPENAVAMALLQELGHPIVSTTVPRLAQTLESEDAAAQELPPSGDPERIAQVLPRSIDVFLDVGALYGAPSSVVDLTTEPPTILRRGSGDLGRFE